MSGDERFTDPQPGGRRRPGGQGRSEQEPWGPGPGGFPEPGADRSGGFPEPGGGFDDLRYGDPRYGDQQYGDPRYGGQQYGDPRYGDQQYGDPRYGDQQYGDPRYGGQQYDDRGYDDPPQRGGGGPNRKVIIATLVVAVLAAVGTGILFGMTRSGTDEASPTTSVSTPAATTPTPTASTGSPTPSTSTASPTTKATKKAKTPTSHVSAPWSWSGMDFGLVSDVQPQGTGAVVTVDRAEYLTGDDATSYYAAHPELEPMDYAVVNDSTESLQFLVSEDALLYGQYLLGNRSNVKTTRITMDQLVTRGQQVTSTGQPILVWLFHTSGSNGPVVYLAEQFVP